MFEVMFALSPFALFVGWATSVVALPAIKRGVSLKYHQITGGTAAPDHEVMEQIIASIETFTDDWKLTETTAQFPRKGSYQIAVAKDQSTGKWQYSLANDSSDGRYRDISPFYAHRIRTLLLTYNKRISKKSVEKILFPNGKQVLLGYTPTKVDT